MVYFVSYDLSEGSPKDYSVVEVALESCGEAKRFQGSVWLLSSDLSAVAIRDTIKPYLDGTDTLFVGELGRGWAGWRTKLQAWIGEHRGT